jgi:hypothetical protein
MIVAECAQSGQRVAKAGWLDFNSIQSGHHFGSDSFAFVSKDYALTPVKPTVDMEPAYENHSTGAGKPRIDAHKVRSQAYSAVLAGAAEPRPGDSDVFPNCSMSRLHGWYKRQRGSCMQHRAIGAIRRGHRR